MYHIRVLKSYSWVLFSVVSSVLFLGRNPLHQWLSKVVALCHQSVERAMKGLEQRGVYVVEISQSLLHWSILDSMSVIGVFANFFI